MFLAPVNNYREKLRLEGALGVMLILSFYKGQIKHSKWHKKLMTTSSPVLSSRAYSNQLDRLRVLLVSCVSNNRI